MTVIVDPPCSFGLKPLLNHIGQGPPDTHTRNTHRNYAESFWSRRWPYKPQRGKISSDMNLGLSTPDARAFLLRHGFPPTAFALQCIHAIKAWPAGRQAGDAEMHLRRTGIKDHPMRSYGLVITARHHPPKIHALADQRAIDVVQLPATCYRLLSVSSMNDPCIVTDDPIAKGCQIAANTR
jgi:hypothetical protein